MYFTEKYFLKNIKRLAVIGSGPSGVATALALLKNGNEVVMFDFGNEINDKSRKIKLKLKANSCDNSDLKSLKTKDK